MKGRELAVFLAIRVASCTQNGRTCGLNRRVLEKGPPGAHARVSGRLEKERFAWKPRKRKGLRGNQESSRIKVCVKPKKAVELRFA